MPDLPRAVLGRFRPEALLRPTSVAVLGANTDAGAQVMANLLAETFAGAILPVGAGLRAISGVLAYPNVADLPIAPDLAVICDETLNLPETFAALAARGTHAAIVTGMAAMPPGTPPSPLRALARETGVRSLGPGSFGVAIPAIGLNATRAHLRPRPGKLALISQSAALCRAVLDWAEPNGVGFSHIVGIGGNDDIGFALILDFLSRDPGTGAILLDIRRIKDPRAFLSAARAAARLRPVVAIRAGSRLIDPNGDADAVFEAALHRAGVLSVGTLEDLLAAAETLTRVRPPRNEALAIVTNAIGPAQMAADAALRDGLTLAALTQETRDIISLTLPRAFATQGGADVPDGVGDIVYAGMDGMKLAEAAALLAGAREVGAVLAVHAPTGPKDDAGIAALAAAASALKIPLLACVMGETTAAAHRRALVAAGLSVFATPEQAVRGFLHLVQHRRNRQAAAELPSSTILDIEPDRIAAGRLLAEARATGECYLPTETTIAILAAYGLAHGAAEGPPLRIQVTADSMFGPVIGVGQGGAAGAALHDLALDLPPLNLTLARSLFARTRVARMLAARPALAETIADALIRVSQLLVDFPQIATLTLDPITSGPAGLLVAAASLSILPPGIPPARLALPPYPADLVEHITLAGEALTIRPIRPEDAEAHGAFFTRLTPEDIRYRFFSAMRELSPEQMARMTQIDYEREMAFIAVSDATNETIGVARLVRETLTDNGEFAVIVQADRKGHGIAGHLMRRLIAWARTRDMRAVIGQVLADNTPMLAFIRRLGFTIHRVPGEPDIVEARLLLE